MATTLRRLAIHYLEDDTVSCTADSSLRIGVGHIVALVFRDRFIWGKLREGGQSGGSASIRFDNPTDAGGIRAVVAYPFIDSYWGGLS